MTRESQDTKPASQIDLFKTLDHDLFRYLLLFFDAASRKNLALTDKNNNAKVREFKLRNLPRLSSAEQISSLKKIFLMLTKNNLSDPDKEALGKNLALYNKTPAHSLRHVAMGLICLSYCQPLDDTQIQRLKLSLRVLTADASYEHDMALMHELIFMLTSKNPDMKSLIPKEYYSSSSLRNLQPSVVKSSKDKFYSDFPETLEERKQWTLYRLNSNSYSAAASQSLWDLDFRLKHGIKALTILVELSESQEWAINTTLTILIPLFTSAEQGADFLYIHNLLFHLILKVIKCVDETKLDWLLEELKKLTQGLFSSHVINQGICIIILINLILNPASRKWAIDNAIANLHHFLGEILTNHAGYFLKLFKIAIENADSEQLTMLNDKFLEFCNEQPNKSSVIFELLPLISKKKEDFRFVNLNSMLKIFLSGTLIEWAPGEALTHLEKMFLLLTKEQRKQVLLEISTLPEPEKSISYQRALVLKVCAAYADENDVERILAILMKEEIVGIFEGIVLHQLCILNKLPSEESSGIICRLIDMISNRKAIIDLRHIESSSYALLALLIAKYQPNEIRSIDQLIYCLNEEIKKSYDYDINHGRQDTRFIVQALLPLSILMSHLKPNNAEYIDNILRSVFHYVKYRDEETFYLSKRLLLRVFNAIYSREDFEVSARLCRLIGECVKPKSPYFAYDVDIMKTAEILLKSNALPLRSRLLFPGVHCDEEMFEPFLRSAVPDMSSARRHLLISLQLFVGLFTNINSETALKEMITVHEDFPHSIERRVSIYCREVTEINHLFRLLDFMINSELAQFVGMVWEASFHRRLACTKIIRDRIRALNENPELNIPSDAQLHVSIFVSRLISIQNSSREESLAFIFWCINRCNTLEDLREFRHAIFDSIEHRALFDPILKRQSNFSLRWHEYRNRNGEAHEVSHSAVKIIEAIQAQMIAVLALLDRRGIQEILTKEDEAFLAQTGTGFTNPDPNSKCVIA